jgi:hypothetical protein
MRLASEDALQRAAAAAEVQDWCSLYRAAMAAHPIAGWCLRNYVILTQWPETLGDLGLSEAEVYWNRYYWLVRFARVWSAVAGYDAGLEQQVFQLLEASPDGWERAAEVTTAAEQAAADQLRAAGIEPPPTP